MHVYARPRRGFCASCDGEISGAPVFRMDEAYCCLGCAQNGPCICTYEADLADDGVDRLGLPFIDPTIHVEQPEAAPLVASRR